MTGRANALLYCSVCRRPIEAFLGVPAEGNVMPRLSMRGTSIGDHARVSPSCIGGAAVLEVRPSCPENYAQVTAWMPRAAR